MLLFKKKNTSLEIKKKKMLSSFFSQRITLSRVFFPVTQLLWPVPLPPFHRSLSHAP
jgi:hypothetical protein